MADLITPTARLHKAWLESRDDWGRGVYQDGAGFDLLRPTDNLDQQTGFGAWVSRLVRAADPVTDPPPDYVHCTYRWIVSDDQILGAIALRHELNDSLRERGGNIGYGVRPSARGRGLASWALGETLGEARALGLKKVLITVASDNIAAIRVAESQGAVLEDVRGDTRYYWIPLS